jgi:glucokinase
MLLAGDIGGTKTLLGLFDRQRPRPQPIAVRTFGSLEYDGVEPMISELLRDEHATGQRIEVACFGVAGPVIGEAAKPTNVPWTVDGATVSTTFKLRHVRLLNDLEAMAYSVPVLHDTEVHVLQEGHALPDGNIALIAAGTGLGEALLHNVGGRFIPSASEGGHADFAARTERDIKLLRSIVAVYGRADVERVVSGRGLLNIHRMAHDRPCVANVDLEDPDAPAMISTAALERRCAGCVETLDLFVEAYGAEAGNLALRGVTTGGVFVGGGIAPKILPALAAGRFIAAFRHKAPLDEMVGRMPVKVILNAEAGLLGAAVFAATI